jgi:formylglycine-generating enzyme required for sulfatase activity
VSIAGPDSAATHSAAKEAPHVFVSFASEDIELARRAVHSLERAGFRCWLSERDIEPAASYPASITHALAQSGALLLILTESANASPHVLREIELAFNARIPILPIRLSGVLPSSDLAYFLSTTQWLDAGSGLGDADLEKAEYRLRDILQRGSSIKRRITLLRSWPALAAGAAVLAAGTAAIIWTTQRPGPADTNVSESQPERSASSGVSAAKDSTALSATTLKVNPRDAQTYLWVPPGRFVMGCSTGDPACENDELPAHAVDIKSGFWLARTEVTRAQYRKLRDATRSLAGENLPMTELSWAEAKAYCVSIGGRLPSEAEWEYAARGGTSVRYYDSLPAVAWFADNSNEQLHPVGMKAPNTFGLYDMLGNASEWVRDRYYNRYDDASDAAAVEEPLAGNASGVARGGSWLSDADGVRASRRLELLPDAQESHVGFRCAIDQF